MKQTLMIEGMMCAHCQGHVADALNAMEGVTAEVDFQKGTAVVSANKEIPEAEFAKVIEGAGYKLTGIQQL